MFVDSKDESVLFLSSLVRTYGLHRIEDKLTFRNLRHYFRILEILYSRISCFRASYSYFWGSVSDLAIEVYYLRRETEETLYEWYYSAILLRLISFTRRRISRCQSSLVVWVFQIYISELNLPKQIVIYGLSVQMISYNMQYWKFMYSWVCKNWGKISWKF